MIAKSRIILSTVSTPVIIAVPGKKVASMNI